MTCSKPEKGLQSYHIPVVGVGFGCKILPKFLHGNKKYRVTGHLGIATDTYNEAGNITRECSYSK
jgi:tRNA U55 pseudouridine synthase TruB